MDLALLILGITTVLFTIVAGLAEHYKKKYTTLICIILIGIIGLISLTIQHLKNLEDKREDGKKNLEISKNAFELKKKSEEIYKLQRAIKAKSDTIESKQNKLNKAQDKVISSQDELLGYATGGKNNKPIIELKYTKETNTDRYIVAISVRNYGKYPLRNVTFSFFKNKFECATNDFFATDKPDISHNPLNNTLYDETINYGSIPATELKNVFAEYYIDELKDQNFYSIFGEVRWSEGSYELEMKVQLDKMTNTFTPIHIAVDNEFNSNLTKFFPLVPKKRLMQSQRISSFVTYTYHNEGN